MFDAVSLASSGSNAGYMLLITSGNWEDMDAARTRCIVHHSPCGAAGRIRHLLQEVLGDIFLSVDEGFLEGLGDTDSIELALLIPSSLRFLRL